MRHHHDEFQRTASNSRAVPPRISRNVKENRNLPQLRSKLPHSGHRNRPTDRHQRAARTRQQRNALQIRSRHRLLDQGAGSQHKTISHVRGNPAPAVQTRKKGEKLVVNPKQDPAGCA